MEPARSTSPARVDEATASRSMLFADLDAASRLSSPGEAKSWASGRSSSIHAPQDAVAGHFRAFLCSGELEARYLGTYYPFIKQNEEIEAENHVLTP